MADTVEHSGFVLPAPHLRFGDSRLRDDATYITFALEQTDRLIDECGLRHDTPLLDFGCGQGRLTVGLRARFPLTFRSYVGIDSHWSSIEWCQRHIPDRSYRFRYSNAHNARYNPQGVVRTHLPARTNESEIAFANSVFTHMGEQDARFYLRELARVLRPGGRLWLTAHVEDDVPPVEENPPRYLEEFCGPNRGALCRVRFERSHFLGMLAEAGFGDVLVMHRSEARTGQSSLVCIKEDAHAQVSDRSGPGHTDHRRRADASDGSGLRADRA